jgi:type I restriction enzyme, S subunit
VKKRKNNMTQTKEIKKTPCQALAGNKKKKAQKNVPTLRFGGFSGDWEAEELEDVFEKNANKNLNDEYDFVLTNSAIKGIVSQRDYFDKDIANKNNLTNYYIVDIDDFVYNPRISKYAPVGPLKRNNLKQGVMSPLYTVLKPEQGDLSFLEKYFETKKWHRHMYRIANYGARHDRMNIIQSDFMKMPIKMPILPEQQKIAGFLGEADEWLTNLEKQKEELEKYKKGIMQKIFSQNIRFRDENRNAFADWEEKRLGDVTNFMKGKGLSKNDIISNGENACIHYGELFIKYNEVITNIISKTDLEKEKMFLSEKNDILMPTSDVTPNGLATASALSKKDIILGGDILIIRGKDVLNNFFAYWVNINKKKIMRLVSGVTVYHVYGSDMKTLKINLPSFLEQQKIADFLSSIDEVIQLKQDQITGVKEWKKGLMQKLFV